jgi:hypothetical protein
MIQTRVKRIARNKAWASSLLLVVVLMAAMLLAPNPAHAATFTVDRNDDPDPATAKACTAAASDCSLRGAIVAANAAAGADAITVPAGTYTLTRAGAGEDAASTGDLDITDADELTISGAGARATRVAGGAAPFEDRIFDIRPDVTATITGLTVTGGKAGSDFGGGVWNEGDLTLGRVAVKGNTASGAGGILSGSGMLNLTESTVSGNSVTGNPGDAGGVYLGGTANITNSTISDNHATRYNGGVTAVNGDALVSIRNSTIASNTSPRLGGGILTRGIGSLVIVKNTVVTSNTVNNCDTAQISGGIIFSQGKNISSDASCPFAQSTDKQSTNPLLGPLANNGGPTDTHALLGGSPAIDAATNTGCPATDQRGVERPQGPRCDIGAFEREDLTPPKVTTTTPTGKQVPAKANVTATFSEAMNEASVEAAGTFTLKKKGSAKAISATVTYEPNTEKATLDPTRKLRSGATYVAKVTTAAKDTAGNALDQNSTTAGNQPKSWRFKVK